MIRNDIINPLLNDFLTTVTGYGGPFFKSSAISRLNDFTDYLSELTYPNFEFAFYPLRRDQNVGVGKTGFGIGFLATGAPIIFPKNPNWGADGMILGPLNNAGEVDFSGKFQNDFQFRKDECSIFYFLQHSRQSFPTTFYRDNIEKIPYFCFDLSYDHFSVVSPNFSKSRFRGRGTTYIYDEIYGEDQKGLQIDWSQKSSEKYYLPQSYSFYQMDKEVPSGQYICINGNFSLNNYSLRTIYGKDPRILSGNFLSPYGVGIVGEEEDAATNQYFFSRRMVIGAGVSNKGYQYDVAGMDHLCPGFLILKGNYSHKAEEIASKMAQCIGIVNDSFISYSGIDENSTPKDFSSISASLTGMKYVVSEPKILTPIKEFSSFSARIKSIFLKFIGIVTFTKYPWGWWGTTSLEQTELKNEITGVPYNTGILNYNYPILGSEYNQITGFVSGYLHPNGDRLLFASDNISGQSGFYYANTDQSIKKIIFPPYKAYEQEKITGFVSGDYDIFGKFTPLNSDIFVSGYYLENQKFYLNPVTGILNNDIFGFISGTIDRNGNFSGFDDSNINQASGYVNNSNLIQFPPYRYVSGTEPVIGYIKGVLNGDEFVPFAEVTYLYDLFGNVTGSILSSDSDISGYFYKDEKIPFPTGSGFSGFDNMPYFYRDLGYEFSGLFVQSSGLLFDFPNATGYMTGFIGTKASIKSSGIFDDFNNVDGFQNVVNYNFTGFFIDKTGFSGIDPEWQLFDTDVQIGILTGRIGSYDYIGSLGGNINFDGKSGFNPLSGYGYSGFFVESSGFKSLNGEEYGFGEMTGIIGYRTISEKILPFNGFTGIDEIEKPYYNNVFVNFAQATGFSGINNQSFGLGIFTGIISSGNLTGNLSKLFASTGISTYSGYDFAVTGIFHRFGLKTYGTIPPWGNFSGISYEKFTSEQSSNNDIWGNDEIIYGFVSGCIQSENVSRNGKGCGLFNNPKGQGLIKIENEYTKPVGNFGTGDFTLELWIKPTGLDFSSTNPFSDEQSEITIAEAIRDGYNGATWAIKLRSKDQLTGGFYTGLEELIYFESGEYPLISGYISGYTNAITTIEPDKYSRLGSGCGFFWGINAYDPLQIKLSNDNFTYTRNHPDWNDYYTGLKFPASFGNQDFTLEFWIKPGSTETLNALLNKQKIRGGLSGWGNFNHKKIGILSAYSTLSKAYNLWILSNSGFTYLLDNFRRPTGTLLTPNIFPDIAFEFWSGTNFWKNNCYGKISDGISYERNYAGLGNFGTGSFSIELNLGRNESQTVANPSDIEARILNINNCLNISTFGSATINCYYIGNLLGKPITGYFPPLMGQTTTLSTFKTPFSIPIYPTSSKIYIRRYANNINDQTHTLAIESPFYFDNSLGRMRNQVLSSIIIPSNMGLNGGPITIGGKPTNENNLSPNSSNNYLGTINISISKKPNIATLTDFLTGNASLKDEFVLGKLNNTIKDLSLQNYDIPIQGNVYLSGGQIYFNSGYLTIRDTGSISFIPSTYEDRCHSVLYSSTGQHITTGWNHIAISRNQGFITLYLNGVPGQSVPISDKAIVGATGYGWMELSNKELTKEWWNFSPNVLDIGSHSLTASDILNEYGSDKTFPTSYYGYIEDLRVTTGIGRYNSNFSGNLPQEFGDNTGSDIYYNNVSLLMHMHSTGTKKSYNFFDSSKNPVPQFFITPRPYERFFGKFNGSLYITEPTKYSPELISAAGSTSYETIFKSGFYISGQKYELDNSFSGYEHVQELNSNKNIFLYEENREVDGYFLPFINLSEFLKFQDFVNAENNLLISGITGQFLLTGMIGQKIYKKEFTFINNNLRVRKGLFEEANNPMVKFYFDSGSTFYNGNCIQPGWSEALQQTVYFNACESFAASSTGNIVKLNEWNHIAITRNGNWITVFLNGFPGERTFISSEAIIGHYNDSQRWNTSYTQPYYKKPNNNIYIGDTPRYSFWVPIPGLTYQTSMFNPVQAYIQDFRITTGVSRYFEEFSISGLPLQFSNNESDLYYNQVDILIPMTGINSSKNFYDTSLNNNKIDIGSATFSIYDQQNIPIIYGPSFDQHISGIYIDNIKYYLPTGTELNWQDIPKLTETKVINISGYYAFLPARFIQLDNEVYIPLDLLENTGCGYAYWGSGIKQYNLKEQYDLDSFFNYSLEIYNLNSPTIFNEQQALDVFKYSTQIYSTNFNANLTKLLYSPGYYDEIISSNTSLVPAVSGITYINAILETGISGMSGVFGPNPSGDTASITCTISSFEAIEAAPFEIYPYIRAVSGLTYLTPQIVSINYYEDMPVFGSGEASRIVGNITGIRYFTFSNELIFEDSGVSYAASPINLSTGTPDTFSDVCEYRPIPLLLTGVFPTILQPPSVTEISDIEGLTDDPYIDSVVLLLNMSGQNLSRNILDSSKYHHQVIAAIGAGQFDDLISYRPSGLSGIYLPWTIDSGTYTASGVSGVYLPWTIDSGTYTASGLSGENNIKIESNTCNFGGSGAYLNSDVHISNETIGLFGGSGVILITGIF